MQNNTQTQANNTSTQKEQNKSLEQREQELEQRLNKTTQKIMGAITALKAQDTLSTKISISKNKVFLPTSPLRKEQIMLEYNKFQK